MNKVTVIDSMMGTGKTSWAIQHMNENLEKNFLYITPFIDETTRIESAVTKKEIKQPRDFGNGKLGNILELLQDQEDIASTHALFLKLTEDCKHAIKQGHYTLILDETINAIEPFTVAHKNDIDFLIKHGSIEIDSEGFIHWTDDDLDTSYNRIKILAKNKSLFYVNQKLLMWRYPPEVFDLFDEVYIMTYMFDASILRYYFDLSNIQYETVSVKRNGDRYELCELYQPTLEEYRKRIHVYSKSDLNDIFTQKPSALSATWFKNSGNADKIKKLKKAMYNYVTNKENAKSDEIMWTTFLDGKKKLEAKGYVKGFVSCNCRATNDYSNRDHLMYCLNVFPHVGVSQFFAQHDIVMDSERYALSEMLQWIWRSKIREKSGEIWVYIPSKRMRNLFVNWLKEN